MVAGSNPMYFTYILQSETTEGLYIGQAANIIERVERHNSNRARWTRNKGPWKLIFFKEFQTRSDAIKLERKLKSFKNKKYLLSWIDSNSN